MRRGWQSLNMEPRFYLRLIRRTGWLWISTSRTTDGRPFKPKKLSVPFLFPRVPAGLTPFRGLVPLGWRNLVPIQDAKNNRSQDKNNKSQDKNNRSQDAKNNRSQDKNNRSQDAKNNRSQDAKKVFFICGSFIIHLFKMSIILLSSFWKSLRKKCKELLCNYDCFWHLRWKCSKFNKKKNLFFVFHADCKSLTMFSIKHCLKLQELYKSVSETTDVHKF